MQVERKSVMSLLHTYKSLFEVAPADTPDLIREVHRLRYQVYCMENSFESPADNPDGLERDRYDAHSLHALLSYRATRTPVGTMRLILPNFGELPMFELCRSAVKILPKTTTAEFSRFAVSKKFRRRVDDWVYPADLIPVGEGQIDPRRVIPHITLGLMTTALQMGRAHGITHVCAIMEPSLLRLLARLGIHFIPVGPTVEHHGIRQPCYSEVGDLLAGVERERPEIWDVITNGGLLWDSTYRHDAVAPRNTPLPNAVTSPDSRMPVSAK
jgi:N-acyl amino acid synthase of PEP-CTERM/exosortase system